MKTLQEQIQKLSNYNLLNNYHMVKRSANAGTSQWLQVIAVYEDELKFRGIERPSILESFVN